MNTKTFNTSQMVAVELKTKLIVAGPLKSAILSVQLQDWKQQQILSVGFSADISGLLCFPRLRNIVPLLSSDLINNEQNNMKRHSIQ